MSLREQVWSDGFALLPALLVDDDLERLGAALGEIADAESGGTRNLLDIPAVADLAEHRLASLVSDLLGPQAYAVRAILFDKTPQSNWRVVWHQDLSIAVQASHDVPGFGPWTVKSGVVHSLAPSSILEHMIAVRVHLDPCGPDNGPVRVLPGTHTHGRIAETDIPSWRERVEPVTCCLDKGGVLVMSPLLLHASSPAQKPGHRRVLHLEYAALALPGGLEWRWKLPVRSVSKDVSEAAQ
jgi:Phytanoyl-CoA dioxygenase (PhyH)